MRTLVISDLHIGGRTGVDVLRRDEALEALVGALEGIDRLVLLGDTLELRHGPAREALAVAEPILRAVGEALSADAQVVLVPGNHDHALLSPWLDHATKPLGLETRIRPGTASPVARVLGGWLGTKRTSVAYPGLWLAEGVYATHGHYQDVHGTVPTFERIAAGVMQRVGAPLPESGELTAEDYERVLAPLYAWIHSAAQRAGDERLAAGAGRAGRAYEMLEGDGHKPIGARVLSVAFPLGVRGLSKVVGPLSSDLSGPALRRNGLVSMGAALQRLGVEADHVIFGHTHRTGPLESDDAAEWRSPGGAQLHNCGNWVFEGNFMAGPDPSAPYWPGGAVLVEGDKRPRVRRLLAGWGPEGGK